MASNSMKILIIGAGWLGFPLANQLLAHGHSVTISRTNHTRLESIPSHAHDAIIVDLNLPNTLSNIPDDTDIIIGCFPPGFRKGNGARYAEQWTLLSQYAASKPIKKLIMVSSTTVYPTKPELMREESATYELASTGPLFSENAKIMLKAEQSVIDSSIDYAIIRCSGLFGPDRHPSRFVSKLKQVSRSAPANMLHLDDAINILEFSINHIVNDTVNATTPNSIDKALFYKSACQSARAMEASAFPPIVDIPDKEVSSDKLIALGYTFTYSSLLDAL